MRSTHNYNDSTYNSVWKTELLALRSKTACVSNSRKRGACEAAVVGLYMVVPVNQDFTLENKINGYAEEPERLWSHIHTKARADPGGFVTSLNLNLNF